MGGGGGKGGGTTVQSTQIPPEVLARYNAVNARAEQVAQQPFTPYGGEFVAPLTPQQQSGINSVMSTQGMTDPYYQGATGLTLAGAQGVMPGRLQTGRYMSPFTNAVVAPTYQALSQEQAMQRSGLINPQTVAAYGGDRSGLVAANLARQQQLGMAQGIAPILQQGYQQAQGVAAQQQAQDLAARQANLARLSQAGGQLAGLGAGAQSAALQSAQAQIAAGTLPQQTQQALNTALYNQFLQQQGYPFQVTQFLANIATGTGALSGSSTQQQQSGGFFGSDERLKEDMEPVGKLFDGQTIYRYRYKDDPEGATHIGVSAQEAAAQKKPGLAVNDDGYLMVNYRDVTDEAAGEGKGLVPESMGGAVMEPGNYARGGYATQGGVPYMANYDPAQWGAILGGMGGIGGQDKAKQQQVGLGIPNQPSKVEPLKPTPLLQRREGPTAGQTASQVAKGITDTLAARKALKEWWNEPKGGDAPASGQQLNQASKAAPSAAPAAGAQRGAAAAQPPAQQPQQVGLGPNQTPPQPTPVDRGGFDTAESSNPDMNRLTMASEDYGQSAAQAPLQQIQAQNTAFESGGTGVMPDNAPEELAQSFGGMDAPLGDAVGALADLGSSFGDAGAGMSDFGSFFAKRGGRIHPFASGGLAVRQHAAAGKFVTPGYDPEARPSDIMDQVVESGMQSPSQLLSEQKGLENKVSGGGGGGDSGLGTAVAIGTTAAKILPMIFSDKRLKENIEAVGKTFDGQNIYRYDMGDGKTRIGLIAQEVMERHPDAVGKKDGYLAVDYKRATDDATPFAYGGLAIRQPHQAGERVVDEQTTAVQDVLRRNAEEAGIPPEYLVKIAGAESRYNPKAVNENSGAAGLLQIMPKTYAYLGGQGDPTDPENNARVGAKYVKTSMDSLKKAGYEPTLGNTYLAHFLGPTGAQYALGNQDKPLAETHPGWAKVVEQNSNIPGIANWTGADAVNWANAKMEGKAFQPPRSAMENVGLGIKSAYRKASEKADEGLGAASSLIDRITPGQPTSPENFWVPALSFVGGMLSSPQPRLAGAIGTGLLAGVEGYTQLRAQQQEDAKNIIAAVKDTFVMRPDPNKEGSYIFVNKQLGSVLSPDQMQEEVAMRALIQGVDPRLMGIPPAVVARAKARLASGKTEVAAPGKPEVGAGAGAGAVPKVETTETGAQTLPKEPKLPPSPSTPEWMKKDLDREELLYMEPGQLEQYVQATPERKERFNLTNENDPQVIDQRIAREKIRRDTAIDEASAKAAEDEMNRLLQRKKDALAKATQLQIAENENYRKGVTGKVLDFTTQLAKQTDANTQKRVQVQDLANRLAQVDTRDPTARLKVFKDWADYFGIAPADRVELANIDVMQKVVNGWAAQGVNDQRLTRAPAATLSFEAKMVPGPDIQGPAGKEILAKYLAEMDMYDQMQREYTEGSDPKTGRKYNLTDPDTFMIRYHNRKDVQDQLKRRTAYHMQNLPDPKNTSREQQESWYKQYGQYGYDPSQTPEFGAPRQPATSGTSGNVPFRVVP